MSRQFLSLPILQTLLPVTFGYSLSSRLSLWNNWGDERSCDEGRCHAHTRGLPWGIPELVGTVKPVHYSRRRLLRRGLKFHVCTINKSAHTKKVRKLINDPRIHDVYGYCKFEMKVHLIYYWSGVKFKILDMIFAQKKIWDTEIRLWKILHAKRLCLINKESFFFNSSISLRVELCLEKSWARHRIHVSWSSDSDQICVMRNLRQQIIAFLMFIDQHLLRCKKSERFIWN